MGKKHELKEFEIILNLQYEILFGIGKTMVSSMPPAGAEEGGLGQ